MLKNKGFKPIGKIIKGSDVKLTKGNENIDFKNTGWDSFD